MSEEGSTPTTREVGCARIIIGAVLLIIGVLLVAFVRDNVIARAVCGGVPICVGIIALAIGLLDCTVHTKEEADLQNWG